MEHTQMDEWKIIDKLGLSIAGFTLVVTFLIFFSDSSDVFSSLAAAIMTASLIWATYIIIRWICLAIRKT